MKKSRILTALLMLFSFFILTSCAHRSTFRFDADEHHNQVIEYCGGQEWGYVYSLEDKEVSPFIGVFFENHVLEKSEYMVLNFAIQNRAELDVQFKNREIEILRDGKSIYRKTLSPWILRGEKRIWQRLSDQYVYEEVPGSSNQFRVQKKKFGGFFGQMALEDPYILTIEKYPNEEAKTDHVHIPFDQENFDEVYLIAKIVIPIDGKILPNAEYSVRTPELTVNQNLVPSSVYKFFFNREKLLDAVKSTGRCASLEEIFWAAKNKHSWVWWMYPQITN